MGSIRVGRTGETPIKFKPGDFLIDKKDGHIIQIKSVNHNGFNYDTLRAGDHSPLSRDFDSAIYLNLYYTYLTIEERVELL